MRIYSLAAVLILALAVLPAAAVESGPSNTVGFITWQCEASNWTPFAFPFTYYNEGHIATFAVNDILKGDFTAGDEIYDQNTGGSVTYSGTEWSGAWTDIVPGHAYWAKINNDDVSAVTAGEVDLTEISLGNMVVGWNPVGLRDPGIVSLDQAGLIASGFTGGENPAESDRIYVQNSLSYAWYNTGTSSWVGLEDGLQPTNALWIWIHPNHSGFEWNYTPSTGQDSDNNSADAVNSSAVKTNSKKNVK